MCAHGVKPQLSDLIVYKLSDLIVYKLLQALRGHHAGVPPVVAAGQC